MGEKQGGASTAAKLIVEHGAALGRVCMALLGDAAEVERVLEQIAQDAGAHEREKGAAPEGVSPRAWLFGLARAACATRISKLPLRSAHGVETSTAPPERAMLAKLRPTEREAVVLHAIGGLDAEEIAVACGVDVATARARIAQGMAKLVEGGAR